MDNLDVTATILQVFRHESAVAAVGLVLAAEQTSIGQDFLGNRLLDPPLLHELEELALVHRPLAFPLLVGGGYALALERGEEALGSVRRFSERTLKTSRIGR